MTHQTTHKVQLNPGGQPITLVTVTTQRHPWLIILLVILAIGVVGKVDGWARQDNTTQGEER